MKNLTKNGFIEANQTFTLGNHVFFAGVAQLSSEVKEKSFVFGLVLTENVRIWGSNYGKENPYLAPLVTWSESSDLSQVAGFLDQLNESIGMNLPQLRVALGEADVERMQATSHRIGHEVETSGNSGETATANHSSKLILNGEPSGASMLDSLVFLVSSVLLPRLALSRKSGKIRLSKGIVNIRDRVRLGSFVFESVGRA